MVHVRRLLRAEIQLDDPLPVTGIQRCANERRHGPGPGVEQRCGGQRLETVRGQPDERQVAVFLHQNHLPIRVEHVGATEPTRPPDGLTGRHMGRGQDRRGALTARTVDEVADPQRVEEGEPEPRVVPQLLGVHDVAIGHESDRAAATDIPGREEQDLVVIAVERDLEVEVVAGVVSVRPQHLSGVGVHPEHRLSSEDDQVRPAIHQDQYLVY